MGLCIRPFGLFIAGDAACRARQAADKEARNERRLARAADGETAVEGIFGDVFGFLGTAVTSTNDTIGGVVGTAIENDPLSNLLGGLGAPANAQGVVDPTPYLLGGAVVVVAAVVFLQSQKKPRSH